MSKKLKGFIVDASTQFVVYSTWVHVISIFILLGIIGYNYYTVQKEENFFFLASKLKKFTPYFHTINFIIAYTGATIAAFTWDLSPTVALMIPVSLFLMISEIKRYKKMRVIKLAEIELQEEFKVFAKKIYTMQVIALVLMYIIAKVF